MVPLEFHTTVVFELDHKRPGVASVYSTNVFFVSWEIAGNSERDLNFASVEWKEL